MNPIGIIIGDVSMALIVSTTIGVIIISLALITHWMDK